MQAVTSAVSIDQDRLANASRHPESEALANFAVGDCSPGSASLLSRHVARCIACHRKLVQMGFPPADVAPARHGPWFALAAGLDAREVVGAAGIGEALYVVRARAGARISLRAALPVEEILVLDGSFAFETETFVQNDFEVVTDTADFTVVGDLQVGFTALVTTGQPDEDQIM